MNWGKISFEAFGVQSSRSLKRRSKTFVNRWWTLAAQGVSRWIRKEASTSGISVNSSVVIWLHNKHFYWQQSWWHVYNKTAVLLLLEFMSYNCITWNILRGWCINYIAFVMLAHRPSCLKLLAVQGPGFFLTIWVIWWWWWNCLL